MRCGRAQRQLSLTLNPRVDGACRATLSPAGGGDLLARSLASPTEAHPGLASGLLDVRLWMTSAHAGFRSYGPERVGAIAAVGTLLGVVLSGPLAVLAVNVTHPQPAWQDAATFARSYHPVQIAPYLGGLVLVVSLVLLTSAMHSVAGPAHRVLTSAVLVFCSAFAAFILFNYVAQTTLIPYVARHFEPTDATLVKTLSMANPTSLAWGVEMWGWGFLGVATWLCALRGSSERCPRRSWPMAPSALWAHSGRL